MGLSGRPRPRTASIPPDRRSAERTGGCRRRGSWRRASRTGLRRRSRGSGRSRPGPRTRAAHPLADCWSNAGPVRVPSRSRHRRSDTHRGRPSRPRRCPRPGAVRAADGRAAAHAWSGTMSRQRGRRPWRTLCRIVRRWVVNDSPTAGCRALRIDAHAADESPTNRRRPQARPASWAVTERMCSGLPVAWSLVMWSPSIVMVMTTRSSRSKKTSTSGSSLIGFETRVGPLAR